MLTKYKGLEYKNQLCDERFSLLIPMEWMNFQYSWMGSYLNYLVVLKCGCSCLCNLLGLIGLSEKTFNSEKGFFMIIPAKI